ncbi:MAG: B12-binding domain-containing radical SAM protein [Athalassotoga sp.]|uniref:B12-binding domain-containing radical SAM protein n=1 Tax=Athalassotoga sp. TaxID=2022597 RepID=UPI003D020EFE
MKVLMVYPQYPTTFWSFNYALKFISKKAALPPLGLITVGSYLPKEWDLKLVDMNCEKLKDEDIKKADYVFISAMTVQRESSIEVIKKCNDFGIPVIAGGPLFTMEPDTFHDTVDYFVLGEAEDIMADLVKDMENRSVKRYYVKTTFCDIEKTLPPRWDLLNLKWYASMSIQYSRGCPYNCEFCDIGALSGRVPRQKNAKQIVNELQSLYDSGWRKSIFFVDDNFIGNKNKLKRDVLPAIIEWQKSNRYPFTFYTEVSIDFADDDELMTLMSNAGFDRVFVGIETPDPESLKEANKYQNIKHDLEKSIRKIQSFGFEVQGGFIVGFDSDMPTIFKRQFDFIQGNGIVTAMVGLLNAPRGSQLYERLRNENRLRGEMTGDNVDVMTNIVPKMDSNVLVNGYKTLVASLYNPQNYYKRLKEFLSIYKAPKFIKSKISLPEIGAFLRSIFVLGIFGKERKEYWKLLTWSLFKKPKAFSKAISFAIYGYHFRKVAEKISKPSKTRKRIPAT